MKKTLSRIILLALIGMSGMALAESHSPNNAVHGNKVSEEEEKGENVELGRSMDKPIVLTDASLEIVGNVQQEYIKRNFPGYSIKADALTSNEEKKTIQMFTLRNKDGEEIKLFFDVDIAFKEFERKNRKELRKLEKELGNPFE